MSCFYLIACKESIWKHAVDQVTPLPKISIMYYLIHCQESLCDVINARDFEMERLAWIIRVGQL